MSRLRLYVIGKGTGRGDRPSPNITWGYAIGHINLDHAVKVSFARIPP